MNKLITLIKKIFKVRDYRYVYVSEFPEKIKDKIIYIEGNSSIKDYWYVKMKCPCGCGDNLVLNLISDVSPFWKFKIDNADRVTFFPSIRKTTNCKSHFWIRKSKIIWCVDN